MAGVTMQQVTVQTGKEIYVNTGGMEVKKYVGGDTPTIPLPLAVQYKAAGLVTY